MMLAYTWIKIMYEKLLTYLASNENLVKLFILLLHSWEDGIDFPKEKLLGDWETASGGQKVKITWTSPYREDDGYLILLPGLLEDIYKNAIVHIPMSYDTEEQRWYVLKHLAIICDSIELMPNL